MENCITKEELMTHLGAPIHYFEIPKYPLCGGTSPIYNKILHFLSENNVGLIITTLLDPLHDGRTINHRTDEQTEWADGDATLLATAKKLKLAMHHAPIVDEGVPINSVVDALLTTVQTFRKKEPNKNIYVHCWGGGGRTSLVLMIILRQIFNVDSITALDLLTTYNYKKYGMPRYCHSHKAYYSSIDFPHLSDSLYKKSLDPIIHTPSTHDCYKVSDEQKKKKKVIKPRKKITKN